MANRVILIPLTVIFVLLCISCFVRYHRRATRREKALYLPNGMLWIDMVCGAVFLVLAWLAAGQDGSIGLTITFGGFVLLGMSLMVGWRNCCIVYDKQGFTQQNFLGMQRSFSYDQVTGWQLSKQNPMESTLYAAGKKISFNMMSANAPDFLVTFSAAYRKAHGGKNMPEIPQLQRERGGFRAHVYNPGEYLAVFLMMVAFVVGMGAWLVIDCWKPITEADGEQYLVEFSSWQTGENSLFLTSPQWEEPFEICGYRDYLPRMDALLEKCDGETTFTVWAERFHPSDDEPFFRIYALSAGEEVYRTFEESTAFRRQDVPYIAGLFGVFLLIVLASSGLIYMVGSNPQRFPKWVVYLCFKKNANDF